MIYLGITKKNGTCGICKQGFGPGIRVYHNTEKSHGSHLAHESCWDKLAATRKRIFTGKRTVTKSSEELDPPY